MKRLFLAALAVAAFGVQLAAQPRYLVNELAPADASGYAEFEYDGASSEPMAMSGGLEWYGGFTLSYDHSSHTPGHVAFELGGEYETLMFAYSPCMSTGRRCSTRWYILTDSPSGRFST